jgi:hypothetical protein
VYRLSVCAGAKLYRAVYRLSVCAGAKLYIAVCRLTAFRYKGRKIIKILQPFKKTTEHEISISQCTGIFEILSVKLLHVENGFCSSSRTGLRQNKE